MEDSELTARESMGGTKLAKTNSVIDGVLIEQSILTSKLLESLAGLTSRLSPVLSNVDEAEGEEFATRKEPSGSSSLAKLIEDNNQQIHRAIYVTQSLTRKLEV